ncbi:hypothetical protein DASC09_050250 [Saccharomycopsis crataegensis]|uniref:Uncharacterized protein n=1 Tax=Saccharomycopsis crataegensis TaxID=43959 RepID=A0AAV5QTZ2_9ASCO|nr:hypothetical protein DASC09_050250 [Saccharomycopsis crataegensis]
MVKCYLQLASQNMRSCANICYNILKKLEIPKIMMYWGVGLYYTRYLQRNSNKKEDQFISLKGKRNI